MILAAWGREARAQDVNLDLQERATFDGPVDFAISGGMLGVDTDNNDVLEGDVPSVLFPISGIPSGAVVDAAWLYWGGTRKQTISGSSNTCDKSVPDQTVSFTPPGGSAHALSAPLSDCACSFANATTGYDMWACRSNVTAFVTNPNGVYTVGGYTTVSGNYSGITQSAASTSIVVVYHANGLPNRHIALWDGARMLDSSGYALYNAMRVPVPDAVGASPSIQLAYHAICGDLSSNTTPYREQITVKGIPSNIVSDPVTDGVNPVWDPIHDQSNQLNPVMNTGLDIDRFNVTGGGAAGDLQLAPSFSTDEKYWLFNVVLSVSENTIDLDSDGYPNTVDCNDNDPAIHPGAAEICDFIDNNCDGQIDEGLPTSTYYLDADGDAYGSKTSLIACKSKAGYATNNTDCDDSKPAVNPGATELCNGYDDDCDTLVDESDAADVKTWYPDGDGDHYGLPGPTKIACNQPTGYADRNGDCNDNNASIHPNAVDIPYDGIDQDCDGQDSVDLDGDGYGASEAGGSDCEDRIAAIHPGAPELDNGIDDDCDGLIDEGTIHYDDDHDGYTDAGSDCNDAEPSVHPGATEVCNGVDDNCNGTKDENTSCYDDDHDGLSEDQGDCDDANPLRRPGAVEIANNGIDDNCDGNIDGESYDPDGDGFTAAGGDCDEHNAAVYPGAPELADGIDNDCDGKIDEGTTGYDDDGDGYSEDFGDCNDSDPNVHTGADEIPGNGIDDDCDGQVDEGSDQTDDDGDGFTEEGGDCNDFDNHVHPGAAEVADGIDNDCDGQIDEDTEDLDGDGVTVAQGDCDDHDGWVNPDVPEMCDGVDNDCDGQIDEGCGDPVPNDTDTGYATTGCHCGTGGVLSSWPALLAGLLLRRRRRVV